jgi:hypothetical protein
MLINSPFITHGHYFIWQLALLHPYRFAPATVHIAVRQGTHILVQYVAVVFCVFTEGARIVCLPLAESRHI